MHYLGGSLISNYLAQFKIFPSSVSPYTVYSVQIALSMQFEGAPLLNAHYTPSFYLAA